MTLYRLFFLCILIIGASLVVAPAHAQAPQAATAPALPPSLPASPKPAPQKMTKQQMTEYVIKRHPEYLEEMQAQYKECTSDPVFSQFHECRCFAMKYLDTRVTMGPKATLLDIRRQAEKGCTNVPAIAGTYYGKCLSSNQTQIDNVDEFCTCFANAMARNFSKNPGSSIDHFVGLQNLSNQQCGYVELLLQKQRSRVSR
jgi:hypothetical protein